MSHAIEIRDGDGPWVTVGGALLHIAGYRYRIIITEKWSALASVDLERLQVRVNGRIARDVSWSMHPDATAAKGYASVELTLDWNDT